MDTLQPQSTTASVSEPPVYWAARAVGVLKPEPKTSQQGLVFANSLNVIGTAFWLKNASGVLITCAHVVQDLIGLPTETAGFLYVGNHVGNYQRAKVSAVDYEHDLAILRLIDAQPEFIASECRSGLDIAASTPIVGSKVGYAGFPFGNQLLKSSNAPTYAEGVVGAVGRRNGSRKEIQITGSVAGGFSGSPVVSPDSSRSVVGVISNGPDARNGSGGFFLAVSREHIQALTNLAKS